MVGEPFLGGKKGTFPSGCAPPPPPTLKIFSSNFIATCSEFRITCDWNQEGMEVVIINRDGFQEDKSFK